MYTAPTAKVCNAPHGERQVPMQACMLGPRPIHVLCPCRFDPTKLQFMELREVPLAPQEAAVGLDIRVVGNDSGEKVPGQPV